MTIATYIRQDLEARIRAGRDVPEKFTLAAIADQYEVSLTPVREAVDELLDQGLLIKGTNRRLIVNPQQVGKSDGRVLSDRPDAPTNWDDVLMQHVLLQSLQGQPIFLREEAFANQFGIGRTLLRRIFSRLSGAGVLEHVPRRGWRIRPFQEEELASYIEVRELLELKAFDLACSKFEEADLKRMLEGNQPDEDGVARRLDNHFHHYIIKKSGNRYIRDFFAHYGGYFRALFDFAALGGDVIAEMAAQHREILEAALAKRWSTARAALANHIRAQESAVRRILKLLQENPEQLNLLAEVKIPSPPE
ncbi:GntR family transcriptional regulator [Thalassoroseus pseudoceratinae]|uniref:GntR family transcriptional regulator n=1 Tax=Thalassoroseus pseudoceratinae TaxID=2713176 RepID=UPI0014229946|nr:GntR family transcriptional regulator [Thalassoroseus pseudoceratinae]